MGGNGGRWWGWGGEGIMVGLMGMAEGGAAEERAVQQGSQAQS